MSLNPVMFSRASDEWRTPRECYDALHDEFGFVLDAAATAESALCDEYFGLDHIDPVRRDALATTWGSRAVFLNPPYSRCR